MGRPRPVSVVLATCDRAESLAVTLASLTQLDHPEFEVIVVRCPPSDRTDEVLAGFGDQIKVGTCAERNVARARNVGVAMAACDHVALIDDDAYPDPAWLDELVAGFDADETAAVGGPVYDHTGTSLQARYNVATRFGEELKDQYPHDPWLAGAPNPTDLLGAPLSRAIVYPIGCNSMFRRDRLVEIGGFDEEYDYYLEETDVCCRLMDRGYLVRALDGGFVYHNFLASHIRGPNRVLRDRYSIFKNKTYFALRHGLAVASFLEVCEHLSRQAGASRVDYRWNVEQGLLTEDDYQRFEQDLRRAFDDGLRRFLSGRVKTHDAAWFAGRRLPFRPFPTRRGRAEKLHVCLAAVGAPSAAREMGDRLSRSLARHLATDGHLVRMLAAGDQHRVELQDGVWVHRVAPGRPVSAAARRGRKRPPPEASLLEELRRVHARRPVDLVQVPIPALAGLAVALDDGFRSVLDIQEAPATRAEVDAVRAACQRAQGYLARSAAAVSETEARCRIQLDPERLFALEPGSAASAQALGRLFQLLASTPPRR